MKKKPAIEHYNSDMFRMGEGPSFSIHASANGLAKLGAFIANGGSLGEKTIISEETV